MVDSVNNSINNSANIAALQRVQSSGNLAARSAQSSAPTLDQKPASKSSAATILAGASADSNLPRGSLYDRLV